MANIPQNRSYVEKKGYIPPAPKTRFPLSPAGEEPVSSQGVSNDISAYLASRGVPIGLQPASSVNFRSTENIVNPTGTSFADEEPKRESPIPEYYRGFDPESIPIPDGFTWPEPNLETTVLRSAPTIEGQYVLDKSQPLSIIKSARPEEDDPIWRAEKRVMLGGRSSHLYEVDHIIPLWAGGADTQANYTVLTKAEHAKKTKAQAVAYTLLANKKISTSEAKFLAMTWKERDLTDIPNVNGDGVLPLQDAIDIKKRWDKQATEVPKVTLKSFFEAIPDAGKNVGKKIDETVSSLPSFLQGVIKGAATGFTGGWVRYDQELNDGGGVETAGNIVGNIGGSLVPIGVLSRAFGFAFGGARALSVANKLKSTGVVGKAAAATIEGGVKTLGSVKGGVSRAVTKTRFLRSQGTPTVQAARAIAAENFWKFTPAVVTYGQIQESFDDEEVVDRSKRFIEDVVYGVVTGVMPPNLRGVMGVAGLSFAASLMLNDSDTPVEDALVSAGIMAALHGVSSKGVQKEIDKRAYSLVEDEITRMSYNTLNSYLGEKVPYITKDTPIPSANSLTREQIITLREEARKKIQNMLFGVSDSSAAGKPTTEGRYMDLAYADNEIKKIVAASRFLELRTLPEKEREAAILDDLYSSLQRTKNDEGFVPRPPVVTDIIGGLPEETIQNSMFRFNKVASGKYPTGFMKMTGIGENVRPNNEHISLFLQAKAKGKASPTLIGVLRNDMEPFLRSRSNDPSISWTDSDPMTTIQIYGVMLGDDGTRNVVDLGFFPQAGRIEGGEHSFNSQKEIVSGLRLKFDINLNKDVVGTKMKEQGLDYILLNLDDNNSGFVGGKGGNFEKGDIKNPFVQFTLNDENWAKSIALQTSVNGKNIRIKNENIPSLIKEVNSSLNAKRKSEAIKQIREKYEEPSSSLFSAEKSPDLMKASPESASMAKEFLSSANEVISQTTPEGVVSKMKELFNVNISKVLAGNILSKGQQITNKQFISLVKRNASPEMRALLDETIFSFFKSPLFKKWEYAKAFPEMKVTGGLNESRIQSVGKTSTIDTINNASESITPEVVGSPGKVLAEEIKPKEAVVQEPKNELASKLVTTAAIVPKKKIFSSFIEQKNIYPKTIKEERNKFIREITDETIEDGKARLEEALFSTRSGEGTYASVLRKIVESVKPKIRSKQGAPGGELTALERKNIITDARNTLRAHAGKVYETKITPQNAIEFQTGLKEGDDMYIPVLEVLNAQNAEKLGNRDALSEVKESLGEDLYYKALSILNGGKNGDNEMSSENIKKGIDYVSLNTAQKKAGDDVIKQLIDTPKEQKEGSYMRTFSEYVDRAMKETLGEQWKQNELVIQIFSSLKPGKSREEIVSQARDGRTSRKLSEKSGKFGDEILDDTLYGERLSSASGFWGSLLESTDETATQPIEYLKSLGINHRAKATEARLKREEIVSRARDERTSRKLSEKSGKFGDEMLDDTLYGERLSQEDVDQSMFIETPSQRGDTNVISTSPIDRVLAGLTYSLHVGKKPTAQNALADAVQFMFEFNKAYKNLYKNMKGQTPKASTATEYLALDNTKWMDAVKMKPFDVKKASEITDLIINDLSEKGIRLSDVTSSKGARRKATKEYVEAKVLNRQASEVFNTQVMPKYKNLLSSNLFRVDNISGNKDLSIKEKIEQLGKTLFSAERFGKDLDIKEILFLDAFNRYRDLTQSVTSSIQRKNIYKSDYKNLNKKTGEKKEDGSGGPGTLFGGLLSSIKNIVPSRKIIYENPSPAVTDTKKYDLRGTRATQEDLNEAGSIIFGELSNRYKKDPTVGEKEVKNIINTAINRAVSGNPKRYGDSLVGVLQKPNQYQGFMPTGLTVDGVTRESQYQRSKSTNMTEDEKKKLKFISDTINKMKEEGFKDTTNNSLYYVHASDGTLWLGKTQAEALKNAQDHEKLIKMAETTLQ